MSTPVEPGKTRKFFPTGNFVTPQEAHQAIQLFGEAHVDSMKKKTLNDFLKQLGEKYNHDWEHMSIAPNGELVYFEDVMDTPK